MKARLPQGMGGGAGNMQSMLQQARKMQEEMAQVRERLNESEYEATVGGGAVTAVVDGRHTVKSLSIRPDAVDPEDVEILTDLIIGAINEANRQAALAAETEMGKITNGINMPGMAEML